MNDQRGRMMESTPVPKLLIQFSIPTIVGMLVNALYNVVDRIFLGQAISRLAIGGVYLAFPFMIVSMAFAMLIGFGGNALSSIELGRKHRETSEQILNNAFVLLFLCGLVLAGIYTIFMKPLLLMFGGSEKLLPYATEYLSIIILFLPIYTVEFGINAFTRGEGNPKISMLTMLIGALVNTVLDYIFIVRWGWGIAGAAWATGIGQCCSFLCLIYYFTWGSSTLKLHFPPTLKTSLILPALKLGTSNFGMQVVSSLIVVIYNMKLQQYGGDFGVSTAGVIQSITTLVLMPIIGLNQGAQPIMGYNYGAGNYRRVKETLKTAMIIATSYALLFWIFIELKPTWFLNIFGKEKNPENIAAQIQAARCYFLMLPSIGSQIICANYFQATEKPFIGLLTSLSRQLLILLPSIYIFSGLFGFIGIWIASPVSDFFAWMITLFFIKRDLPRLQEKKNSC